MSGFGQFMRFFAISLLGLFIDIGIAMIVHKVAGLALPFAALFGFCVAATVNYVQHAIWTFSGSRRSIRGLAVYLALQSVTAGLRVALVTFFETVTVLAPYPLIILIAAAAVTLIVNFVLSRTLVFRPDSNDQAELD